MFLENSISLIYGWPAGLTGKRQ